MKIKICGITNEQDAVWALNYGTDLIGLNFYKDSPRHVSLAGVQKWVKQLPRWASLVGVFVNANSDEVLNTAVKLNLSGVQLHGDETPEALTELRVKFEAEGISPFIMKAVRIENEGALAGLTPYADVIDYFLLDAFQEGQLGGTGQIFDWSLAIKAKEYGKPVFLAGGLTPDNVKDAIKQVQPFGVDVASGVEKSPRKKDIEKMQAFINRAKGLSK